MPRIAAALAVLLTVVTCIGFNTARYPVVWEMVAASDGFTRSPQSEQPEAAPQPEAAVQSSIPKESQGTSEPTAAWSPP